MNQPLKRNESCIIGLPRCDYVFSSTRSCFIAYGFRTSNLEVEILKGVLENNGIEPYEAGETTNPGKNVFCSKICSKIITSQFCIVLLNRDLEGGMLVSNANVNMEYGLMLGFNKYIIPFQKEGEELPFNVTGLDTVKYNNKNFKENAEKAIQRAVFDTTPKKSEVIPSNQDIEFFLLTKDILFCPIEDEGTRNIYNLGKPLGYSLLIDFSGMQYIYLGVFTNHNVWEIVWRIKKLDAFVNKRLNNVFERSEFGGIDPGIIKMVQLILEKMEVWIIVQNDVIKKELDKVELSLKLKTFTLSEIEQEVSRFNA